MMLAACALPSAARADDPTPAPSAAPQPRSGALNFVAAQGLERHDEGERPAGGVARLGDPRRHRDALDGAERDSRVAPRATLRRRGCLDVQVAAQREVARIRTGHDVRRRARVRVHVPLRPRPGAPARHSPLARRHRPHARRRRLASYAHPPGVADRSDALDAMSTFCMREIYAMRAPAGWRHDVVPGLAGKDIPGVDGFTAPDAETARLIALARCGHRAAGRRRRSRRRKRARRPRSSAMRKNSAAPCACGTPCYARPAKTAPDPQIMETVAGYRHGTTYFYSYVHPEAERADPEAQRALTSFCQPDAALGGGNAGRCEARAADADADDHARLGVGGGSPSPWGRAVCAAVRPSPRARRPR